MTYPDLPNNRMIVNGVDLSERYGLILADGYTLSPPSIKTYTIDIPGGNGKLDLTESLLGDTAYDNREQEFNFYVIKPNSFEVVKTEVSGFLHGKDYDYSITMDPGYTYHGRFTVESYEHGMYDIGVVGVIKIKIDADPFKYRSTITMQTPALGGVELDLQCGRKSVVPTIQVFGQCTVIFKGKVHYLTAGTWKLNELIFKHGINNLYLNTFQVRVLLWSDIESKNVTWGEFGKKKVYQWYKFEGVRVNRTWSDIPEESTWADYADLTWRSQMYKPEESSKVRNVYIKYEWGDL